jgi:hypothetical protein
MTEAVSLHHQKIAIVRAIEILEEGYPARIEQKKATEKGAKVHLAYLAAAASSIDLADNGTDIRPDLAKSFGSDPS